jgi:hypothetical protein
MRKILVPVLAAGTALLAACGPDVLSSAASSASSAAVAAKSAQQQKAMADQKIQAMQDAMQQHQQRLGDADHAGDAPPAAGNDSR